jgi:hypothetical protein
MISTKWKWENPLPFTALFPHKVRLACRRAIISALRSRDSPEDFYFDIGLAQALNCVMFDCYDPLARAYSRRIEKVKKLVDEE